MLKKRLEYVDWIHLAEVVAKWRGGAFKGSNESFCFHKSFGIY
jgi:hypothetical protein